MAFSRSPSGTLPHVLETFRRSLFSAPIQAGVPVLDQDVNLMQRIITDRLVETLSHLYKSGWFKIPEDPLDSYSGYGVNTFQFELSHVLVNGFPFRINRIGLADNNRVTLTSTNSPSDPEYSTGGSTTTPTHTTDLVFLEFWRTLVNEDDPYWSKGNTQDNDPSALNPNEMVDPEIGIAATLRVQFQYRLRVVAGATAMNSANVYVQGKKPIPDQVLHFSYQNEAARENKPEIASQVWFHDTSTSAAVGEFDDVDGIVYALPLCLVTRTVGGDSVVEGAITDLRLPVQPQEGLIPPHAIGDHTDTTNITVQNLGDVLYFDGDTWIARTLIFNDLGDVSLSPGDLDDLLTYNGVDWVNVPRSDLLLNELGDVSTAGANAGEILTFNGTIWVSAANLGGPPGPPGPPGGGGGTVPPPTPGV